MSSTESQSLFQKQPDGTYAYPFSVNGKGEILLPRVNKDGVYLAWVNPKDEEILELGVPALAELVVQIIQEAGFPPNILLLTPPSTKSTTMMEAIFEKVKELLSEYDGAVENIELFNLFKRRNTKEELEELLGKDALIIDYKPITKIGQEKPIYLGVSAENAKKLKTYYEAGYVPIIIDDVFSSGATAKAMRRLYARATGQEIEGQEKLEDDELAEMVEVAALALEVSHTKFESAQLIDKENNVRAVGKIPVEPVDTTAS